jgi:hypothetical protein
MRFSYLLVPKNNLYIFNNLYQVFSAGYVGTRQNHKTKQKSKIFQEQFQKLQTIQKK